MTIFEAIFLGSIQGITEFLPISSSGHLVIVEHYLGLDVEELVEFDVLLHMGTLLSILIFFRKDIHKLIVLFPSWCVFVFNSFFKNGDLKKKNVENKDFNIITYLLIATFPTALIAFLFADYIVEFFRSPKAVSFMLIFSALLFLFSEYLHKKYYTSKNKEIESSGKNSVWGALLIGLFQGIALIPGVSRSGSTISAGLLCGLKREESARFSFFLGSIAIFGVSLLTLKNIEINTAEAILPLSSLIAGFISSFIFGIISIGFLMKFLKTHSLSVFSIYLIILAGGLLLF